MTKKIDICLETNKFKIIFHIGTYYVKFCVLSTFFLHILINLFKIFFFEKLQSLQGKNGKAVIKMYSKN